MSASLYIVSTPIGNLDDITLRALRVLKDVRTIAAEDTRHTSLLLRHFGIQTPTTSFHDHNEREKLPFLVKKLADGEDIALVTDAGTPAVSDPGYRLIDAAIRAGHRVIAVPGASAVLAALVTSGFPMESFVFLGFPPTRALSRKAWFDALAKESKTAVFFEAPHRIQTTMEELVRCLGDRPISVCRELTKLHEEVLRGSATDFLGQTTNKRGEFTVVVSPYQEPPRQQLPDDSELLTAFCEMTQNKDLSRRQSIAATARRFGVPARQVYQAVERAKKRVP
jgi:16S rRNA (cytidine1402-2'-O)-methyltransferase